MGDIPKYLVDNKVAAGYLNTSQLKNDLKIALNKKFGEGNWAESFVSNNIYLNHALISEKGIKNLEIDNNNR